MSGSKYWTDGSPSTYSIVQSAGLAEFNSIYVNPVSAAISKGPCNPTNYPNCDFYDYMFVGAPNDTAYQIFLKLDTQFTNMFVQGKLNYVYQINQLDTDQFSKRNMFLACEKDREAREDGAGVWPIVGGIGLPAAANICLDLFAPELLMVVPMATRGIASLSLGAFGYFYTDAVFGQSILTQLFGASDKLTEDEQADLMYSSLALGVGAGATGGSAVTALLEYVDAIPKSTHNEMIGLAAGAGLGYYLLYPAIHEVLGISAGAATFLGGVMKIISNPISSVINLGKDVGCVIDSSTARDVCANNQKNSHLWDVPTLAARMTYEVMEKFGYKTTDPQAAWIYQCFLRNAQIWGATMETTDQTYVSGDYFNIRPYAELGWVFNNNDVLNSTYQNKLITPTEHLLMLSDVYATISCNSYDGLKKHLPMLQTWVDGVVAKIMAQPTIYQAQPYIPPKKITLQEWEQSPQGIATTQQNINKERINYPETAEDILVEAAMIQAYQAGLAAGLSPTAISAAEDAARVKAEAAWDLQQAIEKQAAQKATDALLPGYITKFFASQYYISQIQTVEVSDWPPLIFQWVVNNGLPGVSMAAVTAWYVNGGITILTDNKAGVTPHTPQKPPPAPVAPGLQIPVTSSDTVNVDHLRQMFSSSDFAYWAREGGASASTILGFAESYYDLQNWDSDPGLIPWINENEAWIQTRIAASQ